MKVIPTDFSYLEELYIHNPALWQLEMLKFNPRRTNWHPMSGNMAEAKELSKSQSYENWEAFYKEWYYTPDPSNEFVNFYFEVSNKKNKCENCNRGFNQYHKILEDEVTNRIAQKKDLTEDEMIWLVNHGRIKTKNNLSVKWDDELKLFKLNSGMDDIEFFTKDQIEYPDLNEINKKILIRYEHDFGVMPHKSNRITYIDLLNMLIDMRGLNVKCDICNGSGYLYSDEPKLILYLWVVHTDYARSRGIEIKEIKQEDVPNVLRFLIKAHDVLVEKFKNVIENVEDKLDHIKSISGRWKDHSQ